MRKPDIRLYQLVAKRLNIGLDEMIFLDDIQGNLDAARTAGFGATIRVRGDDLKSGDSIRQLDQYLGLAPERLVRIHEPAEERIDRHSVIVADAIASRL